LFEARQLVKLEKLSRIRFKKILGVPIKNNIRVDDIILEIGLGVNTGLASVVVSTFLTRDDPKPCGC